MQIPRSVISTISEVFSDLYTHAEIDRQFHFADAPGEAPEGNKLQKTMDWLLLASKQHEQPLELLGTLLEDIMERDLPSEGGKDNFYASNFEEDLVNGRVKITKSLEKKGLSYAQGGLVIEAGATATKSLKVRVQEQGLPAVEIEIERALKLVADDPNGAVQFAGNVLEASIKHYLVAKNIRFDETNSTLSDLWKLCRDDLGINPKNLASNDLKKIASGLNSIVDGTMYMRNKKSGAHGRTDQQMNSFKVRPRHARLVIHASHTLAIYIIECLDDL